jgi:methionine-rich copper-binding protein CopC
MAQAAIAHTALSSSVPAKGAVVESPTALTLEFGAEVKLARVQIVPADGESLTLPLDRGAPPSKKMVVTVPKPLVPGKHTVKWRAVADDGHVMTGDFTFSVK